MNLRPEKLPGGWDAVRAHAELKKTKQHERGGHAEAFPDG